MGGRILFNLEPVVERQAPRFGLRERGFNVTFHQEGTFHSRQRLTDAILHGFQSALAQLLDDDSLADRDRVFIHLASNRFNNNMGFHGATVGEWRQGTGRSEPILNQIQHMLNSNENFELDDSFNLTFVHVLGRPVGSGKPSRYIPGHLPVKKVKVFKQSVIEIKAADNLCCARAIVTAKANAEKHPQWRSFRDGRKIQYEHALLLHDQANVLRGPCGPEELKTFAACPLMQNYTIVVVNAHRGYTRFAYGQGPDLLGILYHDEHYDALTSLKGFFGKSYFCGHCYKPYNIEDHHLCKENVNKCRCCLQEGCTDHAAAISTKRDAKPARTCNQCHRRFFGPVCLANHCTFTATHQLTTTDHPSVCQAYKKCGSCFTLCRGAETFRNHKCGYDICRTCAQTVCLATHQCFLQVEETPKGKRQPKRHRIQRQRRRATRPSSDDASSENDGDEDDDNAPNQPLHVFFDIESMLGDNNIHVPILLVAEHEHSTAPRVFKGEDCVEAFLTWLGTLAEIHQRVIVIAHNFRSYDGYPIVDAYHRRCQNIDQIRNGGKILQLTQDNIIFIDSLSFFRMPLAAFPKTFGLTELAKGHFPHKFNTPAHQDYVGPLPPLAEYMPEIMTPNAREELETWHAQKVAENYEFDFQRELETYCRSDVKLLKEGCLVFKEDFQQRTQFSPFDQPTIASACNRDLRMNRMKADTIASEPLHGWRRTYRQSHVAMEWLHHVEHQLRLEEWTSLTDDEREDHDLMAVSYPDYNLQYHPMFRRRLQHARHIGEFHVLGTPYIVDGYDRDTNTLYEFHGCFWHGCTACHPGHRYDIHPRLVGRSFNDVRRATNHRTATLRAKGYTVVEMWECQWAALKANDPTIQSFVDDLALQPPLNPRDAFKGGRTNATCLYKTADPLQGEAIHYYDYSSLYPYVNKYCRYPVGHPVFYYDPPGTDLSQFFGLAQVTILPPRGLFHPVLPFTHGGKLTFPLCRTCALDNVDRPLLDKVSSCSHVEHERCLVGTWCTPELEKAVEMGYEIKTIHEVWHFPKSQVGLFEDYVNTWLKLKVEASGWPRADMTEVEKRTYIADFHAREGILLEYDKIVKNPGLRALAKLMLNSMWGKFGQRLDRLAVEEFTDPQVFAEFLESEEHHIRFVSSVNEDRLEVHYKPKDEHILPGPNLNIFVAAFTTCWARLRLYEALEILDDRVLYYDTDSVIFTQLPGQPTLTLGDHLGDFTDELDPGDSIVEFCSGGPKNYGYETLTGKVCCKVRGFTLNSEGQEHLNYRVLRQNTLDEVQRPLREPRTTRVPQSLTIHRDVRSYTLSTRPAHKEYKLVYSKRALDPTSFRTYPFGYAEEEDPNVTTLMSLLDSDKEL